MQNNIRKLSWKRTQVSGLFWHWLVDGSQA
jgi:hypothetical protein